MPAGDPRPARVKTVRTHKRERGLRMLFPLSTLPRVAKGSARWHGPVSLFVRVATFVVLGRCSAAALAVVVCPHTRFRMTRRGFADVL